MRGREVLMGDQVHQVLKVREDKMEHQEYQEHQEHVEMMAFQVTEEKRVLLESMGKEVERLYIILLKCSMHKRSASSYTDAAIIRMWHFVNL